MADPLIKPTVGRVVWYYPSDEAWTLGWNMPKQYEPLAAIIAGVIDDQTVHLTVIDFHGIPRAVQDVYLAPHHVPGGTGYATWMPYQLEQARKYKEQSND